MRHMFLAGALRAALVPLPTIASGVAPRTGWIIAVATAIVAALLYGVVRRRGGR